MPSRSPRILAVVAGALVVVALTACGSSDKSSSSSSTTASPTQSEQWASDTCTALGAWRTDVKSTLTEAKANPTRDGISQALGEVRTATQDLARTIADFSPPSTSASDQARSTLTTLKTQLHDGVTKIEQTIGGVSGASGSVEAVSTVSGTLVTMRDQMKTAAGKLRSLPAGELHDAIATVPACEKLRADVAASA